MISPFDNFIIILPVIILILHIRANMHSTIRLALT